MSILLPGYTSEQLFPEARVPAFVGHHAKSISLHSQFDELIDFDYTNEINLL